MQESSQRGVAGESTLITPETEPDFYGPNFQGVLHHTREAPVWCKRKVLVRNELRTMRLVEWVETVQPMLLRTKSVATD